MTNKTTHTIHDVDALILEKVILLKTAKGEDKKKLRDQIKKLEKHFNDCNEKHINGKKYPERMKGFPDDKPMNKTELNKLIDSVESEERSPIKFKIEELPHMSLNLEGVSVGKNTFEFVDKGWSTPKVMKPVPFFK